MKKTLKNIRTKLSENTKSEIRISDANGERIAKVIARSGLCSRRDAERLINKGKVKVNNKILLECGVNVTSKDQGLYSFSQIIISRFINGCLDFLQKWRSNAEVKHPRRIF